MYAALTAASFGHQVTLIEKNEKLGKKLFITGKGRCNMTNAADMDTVLSNVVSNPKFLYSAFHSHSNRDFMDTMEQLGLKIKVERGERVFPASDKSSDVIRTLADALRGYGVEILLHTTVMELVTEAACCRGAIVRENGRERRIAADAVIVATGGLSYPSTGSTGDGYRFARAAGLAVTKCRPSLVPMNLRESDICTRLTGLSLKNVTLRMTAEDRLLYEGFGEMLFTHFGVSGPLVLTASCYVGEYRAQDIGLLLDFKPALSEQQLQARFVREFEAAQNKEIKNVIPALYPSRLVPIMLELARIDGNKKIHSVTREEKDRLCCLTKKFPLTFAGLRGYNEAVITQGGVSIKEINPATMESRKVRGLYFAGEVLDLDARTGGYNLQIAWSTAYAAGSGIEWK